MSIDISKEKIFSFTEIIKFFPPRRNGKRPNLATLYRYAGEGCRGIRLEYVMVGRTRCTSQEALQRFFDRLTEQAEGSVITTPTPKPLQLSAHRRKAIEAAEKKLAAAGI